jgi:hypothetical protein
MEVWWEQLAYLRTRTTMAVHINWFGVMPDLGLPTTNVQARSQPCLRATFSTRAACTSSPPPLYASLRLLRLLSGWVRR